MQASEIRELSDEDVRARIAELQEERFRLRFRAATETLENPMRLRFVRRDIARLHTVLRERELGLRIPDAEGRVREREGAAAAPAAARAASKRAAGAGGAKGAARGKGAKGGKDAAGAKGAKSARSAKSAKSR